MKQKKYLYGKADEKEKNQNAIIKFSIVGFFFALITTTMAVFALGRYVARCDVLVIRYFSLFLMLTFNTTWVMTVALMTRYYHMLDMEPEIVEREESHKGYKWVEHGNGRWTMITPTSTKKGKKRGGGRVG